MDHHHQEEKGGHDDDPQGKTGNLNQYKACNREGDASSPPSVSMSVCTRLSRQFLLPCQTDMYRHIGMMIKEERWREEHIVENPFFLSSSVCCQVLEYGDGKSNNNSDSSQNNEEVEGETHKRRNHDRHSSFSWPFSFFDFPLLDHQRHERAIMSKGDHLTKAKRQPTVGDSQPRLFFICFSSLKEKGDKTDTTKSVWCESLQL